VKLDEFCLARSCYLSKAKRERDSLAVMMIIIICVRRVVSETGYLL
jgi:hypothetical protein